MQANLQNAGHDSATCRANLEVAIENDSAAEVVKLSNYLLAKDCIHSTQVSNFSCLEELSWSPWLSLELLLSLAQSSS